MTKRSVQLGLGVACISAPFVVLAGPPIAYDGWTANAGAIDTSLSCTATGVTCTTLSEDAGFIQEQVNTGDYSYIRLIVTDTDATGNAATLGFASESYVPFADAASGGIVQGLATKQTINDPNGLTSVAEIQRGHLRYVSPTSLSGTIAEAPEMFNVRLSQTVTDAEIDSSFDYTNYTQFTTGAASTPDTTTVIGRKMDIAQRVSTADAGNPTSAQLFTQRVRGGTQGNSEVFGQFGGYLVTDPITNGGSMAVGAGTIDWLSTEEVKTTWLVQSAPNDPGVVGISVQLAENTTTGVTGTDMALDIPEPANPFAWDPDLGTAPTFP